MNTSTKLLFQLIRFRLAAGMAIAFAFFIFVTIIDPPLDPEYMPLLPVVGCSLAFLMWLHSLLGQNMFPVTDRQVAWIPLTAAGLVTVSGAVGLLLGQAIALMTGHTRLHETLMYWIGGSRLLPGVVFISLLFWRGLRYNTGFVGLLGFLPILAINPGKSADPGLLVSLAPFWPLFVLGSVFLVWEAPRQTAMLRRLDFVQSGTGWLKPQVPQLHGATRRSWPTLMGDALFASAIVAVCIFLIAAISGIPTEKVQQNPTSVFLLFLLILPIAFVGGCWRANRASGMGPLRALATVLLEFTGPGYAFRQQLGVAHGVPVRCPFCGNQRMPWQAACPHCGDKRPDFADGAAAQTEPGVRALLFPRHDPGAMFFRVMVPIYLAGYIAFQFWARWR